MLKAALPKNDFEHACGPRNSGYAVNLTYDRHYISREISIEHPSVGLVSLAQLHIRTDLITLPCSLVHAGNKGSKNSVFVHLYVHRKLNFDVTVTLVTRGVEFINCTVVPQPTSSREFIIL